MANNERELLFSVRREDFKIQTFRSGGKGGQHQNTTDSGVRIIHEESGCVSECRENRSQAQNKKVAFSRLVNSDKFQQWLKLKSYHIINNMDDIKEQVEKMMASDNLKVEVFENGQWEELD